MSIAALVTQGIGPGATIPLLVTDGYGIGAAIAEPQVKVILELYQGCGSIPLGGDPYDQMVCDTGWIEAYEQDGNWADVSEASGSWTDIAQNTGDC